jgi:hypothetical protein
MQTIRQGDVLFIPLSNDEVSRADRTGFGVGVSESLRTDGVIQEGEATGHHHRVETLTHAQVYRANWRETMVVTGEAGARIVHEEHAPVTLAPNTSYRVHIAREFDYLANAMRYVRD